MTLHYIFSISPVPCSIWKPLILVAALSSGHLLAQTDSTISESIESPAPEKDIFDRAWRRTVIDIDFLQVLASNYSLDAPAIRTRVMTYLDKAKGDCSTPPFAIRTTGYQPECAAFDYIQEAQDWPNMCARLRSVLAACDAELAGETRRAKWQFFDGYLLNGDEPEVDTPKTRSYVARRIVLQLCLLLNAGNYPNDRDFAKHSSSWLTHLMRRGWLSELLARLEPPTDKSSSDRILRIIHDSASAAHKLGGQANTECAIQLWKVLAPRFIRPGDTRKSDDVHYNLAVIYLSTGRYDLARSESALLRPDGELAPCRKYFDKWITDAKAKNAAEAKTAKMKSSSTSAKPKSPK